MRRDTERFTVVTERRRSVSARPPTTSHVAVTGGKCVVGRVIGATFRSEQGAKYVYALHRNIYGVFRDWSLEKCPRLAQTHAAGSVLYEFLTSNSKVFTIRWPCTPAFSGYSHIPSGFS